jgi:hypothetical protein
MAAGAPNTSSNMSSTQLTEAMTLAMARVLGLAGPQTPGGPAAAPGTPPDLGIALASVPIAHDGAVIDAEYHNSLRRALAALAGRVGGGELDGTRALSLTPLFRRLSDDGDGWDLTPEDAVGQSESDGWMPVDLPDGVRLESLAVGHFAEKTLTYFSVRLARLRILDRATEEVFTIQRTKGDATNRIDKEAKVTANVGPAEEELRRVDNSTWRYVVYATSRGNVATTGATTDQINVHALQVFYSS